MPFVEAFRQFQFRVGRENFCSVHVSMVPQPSATGEHKTKPTQASVRELRGLGISPDLIVCRSEKPVDDSVKEKVSNFCHVGVDQVRKYKTGLQNQILPTATLSHNNRNLKQSNLG
jgi:CTP synthase